MIVFWDRRRKRKRTTSGIHNNCDTFYISQNYFKLQRQTIRENTNLIILFPQDAKNLMHIHADHCDDDMSLYRNSKTIAEKCEMKQIKIFSPLT